MMIEDEKPLEEPQVQSSGVGNTGDIDRETSLDNGPTLDEVDLETDDSQGEDASRTEEASQSEAPDDTAAAEPLRQEVEQLRAQLEERSGQYMRIAADFENFRKRTQKERQDLETQVKCSTISEILSVIDNFERARSQIKPQTDGEMTIHKSYQGVYKQLVDALKKLGVSPMRAEGEQFDPNLHEAVMRESTSEHEDGTVIEQLMRGYTIGERVLRHAMVKVATAPDGSEAAGNDAPEA
ncbi:MAG: nucleotide exchange factor GrpE [Elainellaceae cyanobacterium]